MSNQAITLQLPLPVYEVFKSRAEQARRSVEAEIQEGPYHHGVGSVIRLVGRKA